ncbi:ShlB/FhaC/HecB family hemolysin secretion/activation protein [Frateuria hangzhouensis]|uniref:ShlB/FhaC/HecB family hemolysin secretion/activation protein n=1 Tax=Frateuria hangzhouensis TaxID=2995589 RepID=UPI002260A0BF|nr:ShlB/FhaC/HecB family hemolysin secretion/activation protein [Frateuria sp. STR12]MCX7514348.1 BamA/TamA family outer membrane protein [Frateuria sp. STR12]
MALALAGGNAWAQASPPDPAAGAPAQDILVSGVPTTGAQAAQVQTLIQAEYQRALGAAGVASLDAGQLEAVAVLITARLHEAGWADAHAYLPGQVLAVHLGAAGAPAATVAQALSTPAAASGAEAAAPAVPPLREREAPSAQEQTLAVQGFRVQGVGDHPDDGITPATMQALADAQFATLSGGTGQAVQANFSQLQQVADRLTDHYRKAGFIVATAYVPAQTVGADGIVRVDVLEGTIGKVVVKGTSRYRPGVIAAAAEKLKGKPLRKQDIDSALLYARDLPGVTVSSTFQPGGKTGQTDLVMVAHEAKRPVVFTLGGNNYGTELTGRYRAQAGVAWNAPLGIGDQLNANVDYAFDPRSNVYYALGYRAPTVVVPGLSGVIGATRSELQINSGAFADLQVKGPTSSTFAGADWKFVNTDDLSVQTSLRYIREKSRLGALGVTLSDERFDVAELGFGLTRTDQRLRGLDVVQGSLRKSIRDESADPDLVSPDHDSNFALARLSYTRLQFLTRSQRLYFKLGGQYTRDALPPLEQFVIGGPDSVRAYPIADALTDRGWYTSLEYHIDAPGLGDRVSPFYDRPWRELLEVELFYDFGRGYASSHREGDNPVETLEGIGAGLIFRIPRFHHFEFRLDAAVPTGRRDASDDRGYHIYSRFGFTF